MAGSASTITYDQGQDHAGQHGPVKRVIIDWTSDDSTGAVTATTGKISGTLLRLLLILERRHRLRITTS